MDPEASIIIPVYNVKRYISECINSVRMQSFPNIEIILVDDGSTDGSGEFCDRIGQKDERIRVIHRSNGGLSAARNTGLDHASGKYIAFLDSDDLMHPDMIRRLLETAEKTQADIVACGAYLFYENADSIIQIYAPEFGAYSVSRTFESIVTRNGMGGVVWNRLYRRSRFERVRFPEGRSYEDIPFHILLLESSPKVFAIPDPLVYYRQRKGSITKSDSVSFFRDRIRTRNELKSYIFRNTPSRFDRDLKNKIAANWQVHCISLWNRMSACREPECRKLQKQIRRELLNEKKGEDLLSLPFRIDRFLIRTVPDLASVLYRIYRSGHHPY